MHRPPAGAPTSNAWALAFALFCRRRASLLLAVSVLWLLISLAFAFRLPVYGNVSYLLPEQTPSVRQLRMLEKRARVLGTLMVVVSGDNADERTRVADRLIAALQQFGPESVAFLTYDRALARQFAWEHRWLLAPTEDLRAANQALGPYLASASRRTHPLALDLESDLPANASAAVDAAASSPAAQPTEAVAALLDKLRTMERDAKEAGPLISDEQSMQLIVVQTPFAGGQTDKGAVLLAQIKRAIAQATIRTTATQVGLAGDVVSSVEEERAILQGMARSTAATVGLVALGLYYFYRSWFGTLALCYALLCGTAMTFAVTQQTIGHLNIATAFLASIVLGNGINFGIMLLARFFEALREGQEPTQACATAVGESWRGTLAAALAASAAYISLSVTQFRGFRDFGCIASAGMMLCWATAYLFVPPLLLLGSRFGLVSAQPSMAGGEGLAQLLPRPSRASAGLALLVFAASAFGAMRYLASRPFEEDFREIRSDSLALQREQQWMRQVDAAFGSGISGGFVMAVDEREQAMPLLSRLRAEDATRPAEAHLFGRLRGLDDLLPQDVAAKVALLDAIRAKLTSDNARRLPAAVRARLAALTPPAVIPLWGDNDVPAALAWPFTEADGQRGRLLLASSGPGYPTYSASKLLAFTDAVQALKLGPDVTLGGSAFVFSDMVRLVEADGPKATLAATLAACFTVVALLGPSLHALITLVAGAFGVFAMLVGCSALGLRINFLDFVALPITIGIGIDYAVNLSARSRLEGPGRARQAVLGAGGAICLASYTTIIGYGSMLLSSNRGIRSFGHAAMLGEATCLLGGLILTPLLLDVFWRRPLEP